MKKKKSLPFEFVLEELAAYPKLRITVKPMFGLYGVYSGEKIVFILRDKIKDPEDNGVWIATTAEHHESLRKDLPIMRSLSEFGDEPTGWQVLSVQDPKFESNVFTACELVANNDPRIGKIPKSKLRKKKTNKKMKKKKAHSKKE